MFPFSRPLKLDERVSSQLTTSGIDILSSSLTYSYGNSPSLEVFGEVLDSMVRR